MRAMTGQAVELLEGLGVEQGVDALHRRQLALGMLLVDGVGTTVLGLGTAGLQDLCLALGRALVDRRGVLVCCRSHRGLLAWATLAR